MLTLLDGILARGVPIHGIGIEAHLRGDQAAVLGDASYQTFLGELAHRGIKIIITELDVQDATLPADTGARDQAVAALYSKFLTREPAPTGGKSNRHLGACGFIHVDCGLPPPQRWFAGTAATIRRQLPAQSRELRHRGNVAVRAGYAQKANDTFTKGQTMVIVSAVIPTRGRPELLSGPYAAPWRRHYERSKWWW